MGRMRTARPAAERCRRACHAGLPTLYTKAVEAMLGRKEALAA